MRMSQVCTVNLVVRKLETSVMQITPNIIAMESETVLTQYLITNWTLAYNNASNVDSGIQMTIVLKRRILNAILTVYLPTVLVLIIVYATNFFKAFFFEVDHKRHITTVIIASVTFSGNRLSEPHIPACPDHIVHQRFKQSSADGLREDGGCLAHLRPSHSLGRGASPHPRRLDEDGRGGG